MWFNCLKWKAFFLFVWEYIMCVWDGVGGSRWWPFFFISMFLLNSSLLPFFFPEQNLCCNLGVPLNSELYVLKIKLSGVLAYMWKAVMAMHALVCFTVYHLWKNVVITGHWRWKIQFACLNQLMTSVYIGDRTFNTQIIVVKGFPNKFVDWWNDDSYVKWLF